MGSLGRRAYRMTGLLRSVGSPARAGVAPANDHLPWKCRVLREKKGFLRPGVRVAATELSIAAPYPTSGAIVGKPESRE